MDISTQLADFDEVWRCLGAVKGELLQDAARRVLAAGGHGAFREKVAHDLLSALDTPAAIERLAARCRRGRLELVR